jgi:hypothetical protein
MQRRLICVTLFSVAIVVTALYHTRKVHATPVQDDHRGCSVASLKGTYAFHRTGVNHFVAGQGLIAQIGINVEDGEGNIKLIHTTRSANGVGQGWFEQHDPGNYTVEPDCTGTFFNNLNDLVVVDGGKRYFLLAASNGTIVTEEGTRIGGEEVGLTGR